MKLFLPCDNCSPLLNAKLSMHFTKNGYYGDSLHFILTHSQVTTISHCSESQTLVQLFQNAVMKRIQNYQHLLLCEVTNILRQIVKISA